MSRVVGAAPDTHRGENEITQEQWCQQNTHKGIILERTQNHEAAQESNSDHKQLAENSD